MTKKGMKFPFRLVTSDGEELKRGASIENVEKKRKELINGMRRRIKELEKSSETQHIRLADYDKYVRYMEKNGIKPRTQEELRKRISCNQRQMEQMADIINEYESATIVEEHPTYSVDLEACKCFFLKMADSNDAYIEVKKGKLCVTIENAIGRCEMPLDEYEEKLMTELLGEVI